MRKRLEFEEPVAGYFRAVKVEKEIVNVKV